MEKINKIRVFVQADTDKTECQAVDGKDETAPTKDGVGTVNIRVPQTCDYALSVGLSIDTALVYAGIVEITSSELIGKSDYAAKISLKVTPEGIKQGISNEVKIDVAAAKEANILVTTDISNSGYDVTKYVSMGKIKPFERSIIPGKFGYVALNPLLVQCYTTIEAEFVTIDVPAVKTKLSTGRMTIALDKDQLVSYASARWNMTEDQLKKFSGATADSAAVTEFFCWTATKP